ncbi:MAG: YceI family protein [Anaeromyxobacteraceae bacterium]|nr:YceI family protein [Anaeromyxobacteraceae bacterium]
MKTLVAALMALLAVPALAADTYKIEGSHTQSAFAVKHLMISTVRGEFGKTEGTVVLDTADVTKSSVEATIDATTIDTRDAKRDEHLRNADFFEVAKFPKITFKSTKVEKAGDGLKVTGDLTIKGVTKAVVLNVAGPTDEIKDPWGNARRGLSATTKINRKDFGVSYGPNAVVSDEVAITIDAELLKDQPAPAKK